MINVKFAGFFKKTFLVTCLLAPFSGSAIGGEDDNDLGVATALQEQGDILPLAEILTMVRDTTGNNILEIETELEDTGLVYEIYYLDSDGRRMEIYVDARTGQILTQKLDD